MKKLKHNKHTAMIISKIPIFITARGNNDEVIQINKESLKFSYLFIKNLNLFNQTYIISDNNDILDYAAALGFKKENNIYYRCVSEKELDYLEYCAIYHYGVEHNYHPDWIILLNINQIFKNVSLLRDCISNIDDKYDIIASYTGISNKSHLFIDEALNDKRQNKSHLLSCVHHRVKMVDSAIYAVKSSFAFECMEYDDPAEHFWNGKIKYFKNTSLYTDIFNIDDIYKYYSAADTIEQIKELEKELDKK